MARPRDLADRMAGRSDGFVRETFSLPRVEAREKARAFFNKYPKACLYDRGRTLA